MKTKWEIDESTAVDLKIGGFAKTELILNNKEIPNHLTARRKSEATFELPGGRHAKLTIEPQFGTSPLTKLYVDGQLMVPTPKNPITCGSCGSIAKPNDRFCGKCGHAMPSPESYVHEKYVNDATTAIWMLSGLFFVSGIILFVIMQSQGSDALSKLAGLDPNSQFPHPINGVNYTVAALRSQIAWEPWGVLIVNLILAIVMTILAFWGKRAPLAATLVALATYAVVVVTNAIISPASIGQGVVIKIMVVLLLYRGISGALALRTASA